MSLDEQNQIEHCTLTRNTQSGIILLKNWERIDIMHQEK